MLPQRAPSPLESIDHGVHRDERLRQWLPQGCRGVRPRPAAAARSLGSRFLSEAPPVCICRLCTSSHLFVQYRHHDGCLLCHLSINKEAFPSRHLRRADGGSDGISHRRRRLRRLHRSQGEFTCQLEHSLQRYGKFCRHIGSPIAVSLVASILLVFLVVLSAYSLHRRCH
ncbi:unnamed protein product, partial [Musa textilis]